MCISYNVYYVLFWIKADGCLSYGGSTWSISLAIMINSYSSYHGVFKAGNIVYHKS